MHKQIDFIVVSGNEYLMAVPYSRSSAFARWSENKYDAVRLPNETLASMVAKKVGGTVRHFDKYTGEIW